MKTQRSLLSQVLVAAIALSVLNSTHAAEIRWVGKVVSVQDGDTVTLLDDQSGLHRIRISGIDAPEKNQSFGSASSTRLTEMALGKLVVAACFKVDKYGRDVCSVQVNELDVGLEQIRAGVAWHYKKYANEQPPELRSAYAEAEEIAKTARLGLWSEKEPTAPWDWRNSKRGNAVVVPAR